MDNNYHNIGLIDFLSKILGNYNRNTNTKS